MTKRLVLVLCCLAIATPAVANTNTTNSCFLSLALPFNAYGVTSQKVAGGLDLNGGSFSARDMPSPITAPNGQAFTIGTADQPNVVQCDGQTIKLDKPFYARSIYLLGL
mgnify:CR=1 FL=1